MSYKKLKSYIRVLFCGVILAACATTGEYYGKLNNLISGGQYREAAALVEAEKMKSYGEKNALLYYLDRGMTLHYSGDYQASSQAFERAKKIAEEQFTKSISKEAATLLISDNVRPYYGEDFERAMINVFSALNYAYLGKDEDALVEARQVEHLLKTLKVNYGHKNVYMEDAFVRYITGMLYENQRQTNDAYISYQQALDAYGTYMKAYAVAAPRELVYDAIRTAKKLGMSDEARELKQKYSVQDEASQAAGGELVVLNYNGLCPIKIDNFFEMSFGQGWGYVESADVQEGEEQQVESARAIARSIASDDQLRIAFPKYISQKYTIQNIEIKDLAGSSAAKGALVESIGDIAVKSLDDRIVRVRARAIARGVLKFVLAKKISSKVEESQGELVGWLAKTALKTVSTATETADKRCWRSLPDKINMARLQMSEGLHSIEIKFLDARGGVVSTQVYDNIKIKNGKKTFLSVRSAV